MGFKRYLCFFLYSMGGSFPIAVVLFSHVVLGKYIISLFTAIRLVVVLLDDKLHMAFVLLLVILSI